MIQASTSSTNDSNLSNRSFPEKLERDFRVGPVLGTIEAFNRCLREPFREIGDTQRIHVADNRVRRDTLRDRRIHPRIRRHHETCTAIAERDRSFRGPAAGDNNAVPHVHSRIVRDCVVAVKNT